MRILIGTGNAKKKAEIAALLAPLGFEVVSPSDLTPPPPEPDETGDSFEANADEKALAYAAATGLLTVADDSGLEVDALDGRPGVHSARYSGPDATDDRNNTKLLHELADVPDDARGGGYISVVTIARSGRVLLRTRGTCRGTLLREGRGTGGFGYDPLFYVPELGKTFAEITPEEKAAISHRGKALAELKRRLPDVLKAQEPT
ncbi:MAG: non-canonical purine NTP pyrophosphatase, RdgB/HAM1 family [Planctomycetes bacterium]|nr:non-canonical purine NTP pyrophosphatase, RdgB/HAM1 family [Planctomycetota bacterium]